MKFKPGDMITSIEKYKNTAYRDSIIMSCNDNTYFSLFIDSKQTNFETNSNALIEFFYELKQKSI